MRTTTTETTTTKTMTMTTNTTITEATITKTTTMERADPNPTTMNLTVYFVLSFLFSFNLIKWSISSFELLSKFFTFILGFRNTLAPRVRLRNFKVH